MAHIEKTCCVCNEVHKIQINIDEYNNWLSGTLAQKAFPNMSEADRELLISGVCGKCFDITIEELDSEIEDFIDGI